MHYPKVLEGVDSPEQIFHRSFSLGAPVSLSFVYDLQKVFVRSLTETTRLV